MTTYYDAEVSFLPEAANFIENLPQNWKTFYADCFEQTSTFIPWNKGVKSRNEKLSEYAYNRAPEHLEKIKKAATKKTICKYCPMVAAQVSIARWHNEKCKFKP